VTLASADLTLDELRAVLAPLIADAAAFDGWSAAACAGAAEAACIEPAVAQLAFPGGAMDMIDAWFATIDTAMAVSLPIDLLAALPIRERIRRLVAFRLDAMFGHQEALRRAQVIMTMPQNVPRALALGWRSADAMWRQAGDMANDYNHYTKRATLGAVYVSTLAVFLNDGSEGKDETHAFLDRRIDDVMRFEKAKARLLAPAAHRFSLVRFLGRLRYPAT
jgi:ubiquinone biosynthesis protein COQ9